MIGGTKWTSHSCLVVAHVRLGLGQTFPSTLVSNNIISMHGGLKIRCHNDFKNYMMPHIAREAIVLPITDEHF